MLPEEFDKIIDRLIRSGDSAANVGFLDFDKAAEMRKRNTFGFYIYKGVWFIHFSLLKKAIAIQKCLIGMSASNTSIFDFLRLV